MELCSLMPRREDALLFGSLALTPASLCSDSNDCCSCMIDSCLGTRGERCWISACVGILCGNRKLRSAAPRKITKLEVFLKNAPAAFSSAYRRDLLPYPPPAHSLLHRSWNYSLSHSRAATWRTVMRGHLGEICIFFHFIKKI